MGTVAELPPDAACANYILDGITNGFRIGFSHTDHVHVHLLSATTSQTGRHRVCSMLAIFNQPCQKNRSHIHISTLPIFRLLSSLISSSVPSILEHFMSVCWLPLCQFPGFLYVSLLASLDSRTLSIKSYLRLSSLCNRLFPEPFICDMPRLQ